MLRYQAPLPLRRLPHPVFLKLLLPQIRHQVVLRPVAPILTGVDEDLHTQRAVLARLCAFIPALR